MTLTQKLKSAGLWQTVQIVVHVLTQFGYMAVMARLLTKADFGLVAIANGLVGIGLVFSEAGMGAALIQRQNITERHTNAAFQGSLVTGLVVFLILFVSAQSISRFFAQPQLELLTKVVGLLVIVNSISSVSSSLLRKYFKFRQTALVSMLMSITGYAIGVVLAFRGWGVWSLVAATLVSSFFSAILYFYYAPIRVSFTFHWQAWKELFSFGSGIILLRLSNYLGSQGLNLILGKIFDPIQLGVFERTNQIKTMPSAYLGNILDTIMFPAMAEIQTERDRLFKVYQNSLGLVNSLLMPVSLFLIIFANEIVMILLGPKWPEAVLPLRIMLVVLPFSSSGRMADSVVRATGLIYKNVARKFLYVLVLLSSVSFGAFNYGIVGAAMGVTFSYLFNYCIMLILVKHIFDKPIGEIFIRPILDGLRLSAVVVLAVGFFATLLGAWQHDSIVKFLIVSLLVAFSMLVIGWRAPAVLGSYLQETIRRVLPKKTIE